VAAEFEDPDTTGSCCTCAAELLLPVDGGCEVGGGVVGDDGLPDDDLLLGVAGGELVVP
jgi:hypothetical protein